MKEVNLEPDFASVIHKLIPFRKMKGGFIVLSFWLILANTSIIYSQAFCPGGGFLETGAVMFDTNWTNGCSSGVSCTGGATFDNRAGCEPTTAIDPCAPAPTAGCVGTPANSGSDLWFKFVAGATSVTINVQPSVSFRAVIQAFSGGPACGSLVDIGCIKNTGPSAAATLNLAGLTIGQTYYYRVLGNGIVAQRTGSFCFCGSTGLMPLPIELLSFEARCENEKVLVEWTTVSEINNAYFNIERSTDAVNYQVIKTIDGAGNSNQMINYTFTDEDPLPGVSYYRIKQTDYDGGFKYYDPVAVNCDMNMQGVNIYPNPTNNGTFYIAGGQKNSDVIITNSIGETILETKLISDKTEIVLDDQPGGIYFIQINSTTKTTTKKLIFHP